MNDISPCLTKQQRAQIERHFRAVHEIMLACNYVTINWGRMNGTTSDGRDIAHIFKVEGYMRK